MRALSREIANLLEANGLGSINGTEAARTIWVGELPQAPVQGIILIESPSPPPHQYIDTQYTIIDIWVRHPNYPIAYELIQGVYNQLHRRYAYTAGRWYVSFSQALGGIVDVDRDIEGGKLLRLSVQFICRNLDNIS